MNAGTTTDSVHSFALTHTTATTVPVVGAIDWRKSNTPAQVTLVDSRRLISVQFLTLSVKHFHLKHALTCCF